MCGLEDSEVTLEYSRSLQILSHVAGMGHTLLFLQTQGQVNPPAEVLMLANACSWHARKGLGRSRSP